MLPASTVSEKFKSFLSFVRSASESNSGLCSW